MVNKKFCLGILLMVLVFGMTVVGCKDDDVQIVAFEYAESARNVTVSINGDQVNVSFDGVKNALSYDIYGQLEGGDIKYLSTVQANGSGRNYVNFLKSQLIYTVLPPGYSQNWHFGVTVTDIDKNHVPSKIVWSDYINIPLT